MDNSENDKLNVADDSGKNSVIIHKNVNIDENISKEKAPNFLTASELLTMREKVFKNKNKDDDLELYKGHKFYYPSDCAASKEIVEDILDDNKKSLKLQRIARNKDCLKAVWNEKENVAVVPHLKGKTTQHMGMTVNGKCVLSPEEALFLLEKDIIEVENNEMPLSVEEAYSVMLKGKLAVEKYAVYTHLSQQGFIVVRHQSRIGPNYLQVMNLSKKKKRKRKAEDSTELPEQKRLTFSGVFPSNSKSVNSESNSCDTLLNNDASSSNDKFVSSDTLKNNNNADNEKMDLDSTSNDVISSNFGEVDSQPSLDRETMSNNDIISSTLKEIDSHASLEKETSISCFKEQTEQYAKDLDFSTKDSENFVTSSNICMKDKQDEIEHISKNVNEIDNNEPDNESNATDVKNNEIDVVIDENSVHETNVRDDIIDVESINNNEIDVVNINKAPLTSDNDGDASEVIIEDDQKSDINVEDSGSFDDDEEYESTDESMPVVYDEASEESLDVYTYSPNHQQNDKDLNIGAENAANISSKTQDEDVTLVRVMKKEKKPLAVIDLLSDEEENNMFGMSGNKAQSKAKDKNTFEDSDEDIQVLDEVSGTSDNKDSSHRRVNVIKSESTKLKTESCQSSNVKAQFGPLMNYPDMFKKDMICISRPFLNLLPIRCLPAKEVYILYPEKSSQTRSNQSRPTRLWNSYKDMQEYQRERRRQKQRNSYSSRSSGPFRDQNNTLSNQIPPFGPPDYSRDFAVERNQNYPVPVGRGFHQPPNSERGLLPTPSLLPNPTSFNSPNNMPFSMNVHSLQNLSASNPTAFVNEVQKTVYSVASNIITTILNLNPNNSHSSYPPAFNDSSFMNFNPLHNNNFSVPPGISSPMPYNSSIRNDYQPVRFPPEHAFSGERYPASMNESPFTMDNSWRQSNNFRPKNFTPRGPSFPCKYRTVRRKRDWNDVKAAVEGTNLSDSGSDIEEVPINLNRFLYSNDIKPLIDPGTKLPVGDALKALKLTQLADLCDINKNIDRFLPATLTLEISFDVYLPHTKYRRSEPSIPHYRIIVVRASDPVPRYSELVNLQRKWNDGASLQVAVVDHGDVSFYSFNNVNIQELVPFDSLYE